MQIICLHFYAVLNNFSNTNIPDSIKVDLKWSLILTSYNLYHKRTSALLAGFKIFCILLRSKISSKRGFLDDIKLHLRVGFQFWRSGELLSEHLSPYFSNCSISWSSFETLAFSHVATEIFNSICVEIAE